jgi:hypothetical protein
MFHCNPVMSKWGLVPAVRQRAPDANIEYRAKARRGQYCETRRQFIRTQLTSLTLAKDVVEEKLDGIFVWYRV